MMQNGMIVDIKIQSFGDVITNSSSEVFCIITSNRFEELVEILKPLFPGFDSDLEPTMDIHNRNSDKASISISFPHGMMGHEDFYKQGLTAILDRYIGSENYTITYEY